METGKLTPKQLQNLVLRRLGKRRKDVLLPPGLGEDSAIIDFGEEVCVVATDPITGASGSIGKLAVHISCNDIAAAGAVPIGIQVCLLLPPDTGENEVRDIMQQIEDEASNLGIEILGGHTEVTGAVTQNVIVATALGRTKKDKFITSGGAKPGDYLVMSKGAGIEGAGILATDFSDLLFQKGLQSETIEEAKGFLDQISVIEEGKIGAGYGATALHDVTEGGILGAVFEMSSASDTGFTLREKDIYIPPAVGKICKALNLDPLKLISSGSMIFASPDPEKIIDALKEKGIKSSVIGKITSGKRQLERLDGSIENIDSAPRDELWSFLERNG